MTKKRSGLIIISIIISCVLLYSCNFASKNDTKSDGFSLFSKDQPDSKNCEEEYQILSEQEFHSIETAKKLTNQFLNDFSGQDNSGLYCDNVKKMQKEFEEMGALFSKIDVQEHSSTKTLYEESLSKGHKFSGSDFQSVRKTWEYMYDTKLDEYREKDLRTINDRTFRADLQAFAQQLCNERWGGGVFSSWTITRCYLINNEITVENVDGKYAKKGFGTYHIAMEGSVLGVRSGSVDVYVEGTMGLNNYGDIFFQPGNHQMYNVEGGLTRR